MSSWIHHKVRRPIHHKVGLLGRAIMVVAVIALMGVAGAVWTSTSNGNSRGRAATLSFTVAASTPASGVGTLYPSSSATGSLTFSVTNPNAYAVRVTGVALQGGGSVTSDDQANCPAANVTMTTVSGVSGASYDIAAGATTTITVPGALAMALAAPNGCHDVAFTIPVAVTVAAF